MERVVVLDRVSERHPDVLKEDAEAAWNNCLVSIPAFDVDPDRYLAIGVDRKGRLIELIVIRKQEGYWLIVHGQTPAQKAIREKLGLGKRQS